jgi:hypothetical protein
MLCGMRGRVKEGHIIKSSMHESMLRDFLLGKADAEALSIDIKGSLDLMSPPDVDFTMTSAGIVKMDTNFDLSRRHLLTLCDAFLSGSLSAIDLQCVGFALIASERFTWDAEQDATLAEILYDWAAPEINYPLNVENIERCRRWLEGTEKYPARADAAQ